MNEEEGDVNDEDYDGNEEVEEEVEDDVNELEEAEYWELFIQSYFFFIVFTMNFSLPFNGPLCSAA